MRHSLLLLLCSLPVPGLKERPAPQDRVVAEAPGMKAASCTVCHPGSLASLRRSHHAKLIEKGKEATSCSSCHEKALAHAADSKNKSLFPAKAENACSSCHEGETRFTALSTERLRAFAHPSKARALELLDSPSFGGEQGGRVATKGFPSKSRAPLLFDGLLRLGWRFVDVDGSERGFDQDFGLDGGFRLARFELSARHAGEAALFHANARDIDEREMGFGLRSGGGLSRRFSVDGTFQRRIYVHDAQLDFYSLDNRQSRSTASLSSELGELGDTVLSFTYENLVRVGRTLAARIGNENLFPLQPLSGVPVDRRLESNSFRIGLEKGTAALSFGAELGWEEQRSREGLFFSRQSPANPGFTEIEDSSASSSLRGPDASFNLGLGDENGVRLSLAAHGNLRQTRYVEDGTLIAFDTSAFTTDSFGSGSGHSRRLVFTATLDLPVWDGGRFAFELGFRDSKDVTRFDLTQRTTRPSPPVSITVLSFLDHLVRLQERESQLGIISDLSDKLSIDVGYGFLEQRLLLPDLEPGDFDFHSGTLSSHGPNLSLDWRPDNDWSFSAAIDYLATGGKTPTETEPDQGIRAKAKIRHKLADSSWFEVNGSWDRRENDLSSTERDRQVYGGALSLSPWDGAQLETRGNWSRIHSRTLSTFFLPAPTPVPTFVGFRGESTVFEIELETELNGPLHSSIRASYQRSTGSFASSLFQFEESVSYKLSDELQFGLTLRRLDFDDRKSSLDDYATTVWFLWAELRF